MLILNYVINKVIALDPDLHHHLAPLKHKCLQVIFKDFAQKSIYCTFDEASIHLSSQQQQNIDVSITLSISGKVYINGDAMLAQSIQKLYFNLNIDWEEELSHFTGDAIAHQIVYRFKEFKAYQLENKNSLEQMVTEYLQEESGLLPTKYEIDEFMHEVDNLRLDVDRLEAKVKIHESS